MRGIDRLRRQPPGRWFVVTGTLVGLATFGITLTLWNVYWALMAALGATFVWMNVLGTAERYWANQKVAQAQTPGGGGVGFQDDLRETLEQLNQRVTAQMEDVNKRLYDLEKVVFKEGVGDDDPGNRDK